MAKRYNVRVREDYRWGKARVSGREFHKGGEVMAEGHINDEMRASPLLVIEPMEQEADATDAASELASEYGLDLAAVEGSGHEGRILVSDVRDAVGGE